MLGSFFFFWITKFFDKFNSASTLLYQHHNKKHFILFLWYVLVYKWHLDLTILHVCLIFFYSTKFLINLIVYNAVPVSHHKAVHTFSLIQSCIKKSIMVLVTCNLLFYTCIDLSEITNAYTCYFEKVYNAVFLTSQHIHVPVHG